MATVETFRLKWELNIQSITISFEKYYLYKHRIIPRRLIKYEIVKILIGKVSVPVSAPGRAFLSHSAKTTIPAIPSRLKGITKYNLLIVPARGIIFIKFYCCRVLRWLCVTADTQLSDAKTAPTT